MKKLLPIIALIAILTASLACDTSSITPPPAHPANPSDDPPDIPPGAQVGTVSYVVDGDTIEVEIDGLSYRVRYIGINTPEWDEPCGVEATNVNTNLVLGQTVILVKDVSDTDQYDRLLRYVYVDELFVNAYLVTNGWAESNRYDPDTSQYDYLEGLEEQARSQNLGCWASGAFDN